MRCFSAFGVNMKKRITKILSFFLATVLLLSLVSCGKNKDIPEETSKMDNEAGNDPNINLENMEPDFVNPLTGLECDSDITDRRPLAIMLNNIYQALPQVGISKADVLFECLAEGGITRLMGVFADYEELGVVGSVRSSRPYYIDFAQMFDAIYCHAGGSEDAYGEMSSRGIDHIDGVRGDPLGVYYRDETRMQTMSYEHTLMTTAEGLLKTVEYYDFRTELRDGFELPWELCEYNSSVDVGNESATHINIPVSAYQTVDYYFDTETKSYLRYQYNGEKHIDGETGEQLSFENVIILFCDTWAYDDYGRLKVTTTGSGTGYIASMGKYSEITWSRDSREGNLTLTDSNGDTLCINRGKTFINICNTTVVPTFDNAEIPK